LTANISLILRYNPGEQVIEHNNLDDWKLYLVEWGYNTASERQAARETGRVEVIDKAALEKLAGAS
jgi:hypothetical protein